MSTDVDYQDMLDETDVDLDGPVPDDLPRGRATTGRERDRDHRRAIEELREQKRLRALLEDYDLDDDDL